MTPKSTARKPITRGSSGASGRQVRAWHLLREAGISQEQVAAEAGVHRATVCKVLSGQRRSRDVEATIRRLLGSEDLFAPRRP
jgi:DNA-binding transcriptional regulator LsrR (DeoR family)